MGKITICFCYLGRFMTLIYGKITMFPKFASLYHKTCERLSSSFVVFIKFDVVFNHTVIQFHLPTMIFIFSFLPWHFGPLLKKPVP